MILIAPTAFKGTLGAAEAAAAMAAGARHAAPAESVVEFPLSDGGPGLIDSLSTARGGRIVRADGSGPLGEGVVARILERDAIKVIESADVCGLHLVPPDRRDPLRATTHGLGRLIETAARGAERIVVGLGGSATVDGGAGMAQALGWRLVDRAGVPIPRGGGGLARLDRILPPVARVPLPAVVALADVHNSLLGSAGAATVFGPQKGAGPAVVRILEEGLARLADRIRADLGRDVAQLPCGGAAGGLGAGLAAFLSAPLERGSDWVLATTGFDASLWRARLVVTGEGEYDDQSAMGKITGEVVARARNRGVAVLVVAGRIRAALPDGVTGVDGQGETLTADALGRLVGTAVTALLQR